VRATVEDRAAVGTHQVREACGLPASFGRRLGRGNVLVAKTALEQRSEMLLPSLVLDDPRSRIERRLVTHVLLMAAGELYDPVPVPVLVVADDCALHAPRVRPAWRATLMSEAKTC
jgi:hypothetical protein